MDELIKNIKIWRTELERQNAGMGTMMVFDSICTYLGDQERKKESYRKSLEKITELNDMWHIQEIAKSELENDY